MCAAFELKFVWPKLLQFLVFVLPDFLSDSDFLSFYFLVCMLAFMLVCEFLYILTLLISFSGFETRTITVSCPKDLSVGHLNIYHLANKVTDVNVFVHQSDILYIFDVSLTSVTRWLAFQIIQFCEETRMNLGIQG